MKNNNIPQLIEGSNNSLKVEEEEDQLTLREEERNEKIKTGI